MTNHPNRGWRSRWTVDSVRCEARHGPSGLVVRFQPHPEGGWAGEPTNGEDVFAGIVQVHGDRAASMVARLMREAGEIFGERHDQHR